MRLFSTLLTLLCTFFTACSSKEETTFEKYTIEQFLNTKSYAGGDFTFDEKRILFSSDENGVFNVYSITLQGGKQTLLTNSKHHAMLVISGFPDDDRFLFTSDELGNELHHIYMRDGDGTIRDLTPFEGARSMFAGWSHDKKGFFFTSNKRDPKYMDLYELDLETFQPKLLFKNDQGFEIGAISPNKHRLALNKTLTSNNSEVYLYDLTTHKLKNITPHEGDVNVSAASFSRDSSTLYFLTDQDSDFTYLKKYNLGTESAETVEKYDWDIVSCNFSHNGRYRVTAINDDGRTVVKVYDEQDRKSVKLPELPDGDITHVQVARSEKTMFFYVNGDRSPSNLYVYTFGKGTYRKLTNSLSPDINPDHLVDAEVIRYPSYDGLDIPALLYTPNLNAHGSKVPALIWVHGGPGGQSRKNYNYLIQYLVNHGYAVLAVNNRGSSGYGKNFYKAADLKHGEADLDDCMIAKTYLNSLDFIDGNKIGIIGGSYGGYITLAALTFRPNEMAVGVDIFGVSNWVRTLKSIPEWWESEREALYQKIGNPDTDAEYLESISPLFHAKNITKPLLVLQGANDPRVLKIESDQIIEAVSSNNIPYRYVVFDDEGHGFLIKQNRMTAGQTILEFLDEHLR